MPQLQRFAKLALGSGGSSGDGPGLVTLQLAEEPAQAWWPQGWHPADRVYAYGAPITRLAVTSNAIHDAVANPPARLQALLQKLMTQQGGKGRLALVPASTPLPEDAVLLHEENSLPMYGLLSLANTESHNFTAEVLLRSASGTWNLEQARQQATLWLQQQGLPTEGVGWWTAAASIAPIGSPAGFWRRCCSGWTSIPTVASTRPPWPWPASGAPCANLYIGTPLQGRFRGKTGTISGVRSISGYLDTAEGIRYVSAIANGAAAPNQTIGQVLRQAQTPGLCPAL